MRILQFSTSFMKCGGIQNHVRELSAWLHARGHDIVFAGDPYKRFIEFNDSSYIALPMFKVSRDDGNIVLRIVALFRAAWSLRRSVAQQRVDIIHVHETAPALVAKLATIGKRIPIVMTFHGSEPERVPQVASIAKFTADLTASPSRLSLESLIAHGVDPKKAQVLGLGIKPLPAIADSEITALRQTYLPDGKGTMIFSPSRLAPQKGIDVMIKVVKRVIKKHPDTIFVVAGDGPLTGQVDEWAEAAGVAQNMRFLGAIDTVPAHLKAADFFLLTSRWEALPISIVEAFRAGLPVIATDCGGVSELVDETVGRLCLVEEIDQLTQAVLDLIESPGLRQSKGAAALDRSREDRFDVEAVYTVFESTYNNLIEGRPETAPSRMASSTLSSSE